MHMCVEPIIMHVGGVWKFGSTKAGIGSFWCPDFYRNAHGLPLPYKVPYFSLKPNVSLTLLCGHDALLTPLPCPTHLTRSLCSGHQPATVDFGVPLIPSPHCTFDPSLPWCNLVACTMQHRFRAGHMVTKADQIWNPQNPTEDFLAWHYDKSYPTQHVVKDSRSLKYVPYLWNAGRKQLPCTAQRPELWEQSFWSGVVSVSDVAAEMYSISNEQHVRKKEQKIILRLLFLLTNLHKQ